MPPLDLTTPVGNWVAMHPQTSRVFESLQIDYCCGGGTPLEQACRDRHLDPQQVVEQLNQAVKGSAEPAEDWLNASLAALCDHIEHTHHAYLHRELPRLANMISKVVAAHGTSHPELSRVEQLFAELRAELEPHMFKEERVLFPAIRRIEQSDVAPMFPFGTVANPIGVMEHEHDRAGECLAQIRAITSDYKVPQDACNTYRAMLDGLREVELDMHQHVHKENNILFPRAISLEGTRVHG
jgi:regulator of cell morphogenesis and NO signaling